MKIKTNKKAWQIIKIVAIITALIPILITAFELITTEKESVIFLEGYSRTVGLLVLTYYAFLITLAFLWLIKQVTNYIRLILELKNEKTKTELLHLKSQVNPHFFFNMLNNLYGLVGKNPKQAQQLILKLSDLMRYSIYDGQKEFVSISEEIIYLKNYIELNKMRYHKKIDIRFDTDISDNNPVMPLLFIILLENAFKHGVETLREKAYVHIKMVSTKQIITCTIENNFEKVQEKEQIGIGLENLKRRLELAYPDQYDLSFNIKNDVYKVQLSLQVP